MKRIDEIHGPPATRLISDEIRHLLRLSIPLALAQAGVQLMSVVDVAVVGRLGSEPLAGVGIASAIFFFSLIFASGIVMGTDPLFAQCFGAGLTTRARTVLWQGAWIATACSIAVIPLFLGSEILMQAFAVDPAISVEAKKYLDIRGVSFFPAVLYVVFRGYLQAKETTRAIVVSIVASNVFNLLANLLLVFGGSSLPQWTGLTWVPAMGLEGAAWASVISTVVLTGVLFEAIRRSSPSGEKGVTRLPVRKELSLILRVGMPVGLQMGAETAIFALVGLLTGRIGAEDVAAHQIALSLSAMSFTVAVGIGTAGGVRVGREIGGRHEAGTRRAGLVAFACGASFMSLTALLFILFPEGIAMLLTSDRAVIEAVIPLLAVAAVFQISDGVQAVGSGVLRGAGDTTFAFIANLVGHWLIGFPTALFVGFELGLGVIGLWWGLCAGLTVVAVTLLVRFHFLSRRGIRSLLEPEMQGSALAATAHGTNREKDA